jgi:hypothetical protein
MMIFVQPGGRHGDSLPIRQILPGCLPLVNHDGPIDDAAGNRGGADEGPRTCEF